MEKITIFGRDFEEGEIVVITQKPGYTYGNARAPELIGRLYKSGTIHKMFNHDLEIRPCPVEYGTYTLHLRSEDILSIQRLNLEGLKLCPN